MSGRRTSLLFVFTWVLKQPDNFKLSPKKMLTVLEAAVLLDDARGKRILVIEEYSPMVANNEYILFLRENGNGVYCIINIYRGLFNLSIDEDTTPRLNELNILEKQKFHDMKTAIAKKYSLSIKEID